MQAKPSKVLYPLFTAIYPILFLLAVNVAEIPVGAGWRLLILSIVLNGALFLILARILRHWHRAGLATFAVQVALFSYGHIYGVLKNAQVFGILLGRHRLLAPLTLFLLAVALFWVIRRLKSPERLTSSLNLLTFFILILPAYQVTAFQVETALAADGPNTAAETQTGAVDAGQPDIYYIVLDAYPRHDDMLDYFEQDNQGFIDELSARGFQVATCSQSNYAKTKMSLASTLDMQYLDPELEPELIKGDDSPNWVTIGSRIRRGEFRKLAEAFGYTTVAYETGFFWTEWDNADIFIKRDQASGATIGQLQTFGQISEFEALFLKTTFALAITDSTTLFGTTLSDSLDRTPRRNKYERVQFIFDTFETTVSIPGPKFVFVHLLSPHTPYVFNADGDFLTQATADRSAFRSEVQYLNQSVLETVDLIRTRSKRPAVIVLQGDHGGPGTQPLAIRMNILNAYYFPENDVHVPAQITPVNSFRLIADTYLGTSLGQLEDISYYSTNDAHFSFETVSNPCP
jgi:hypothetical protein